MNKHLKHIVYLSIWTFTVVVVWIGVLIFQQATQTGLSQEVLKAATPIDSSFDTAVLNSLDDRVQVPIDLSSPPPQFMDSDDEDVAVEENENSSL